MNFKTNIIAHTFRNKYLKYTGNNYSSYKNSNSSSIADEKIANWFYEDEEGNLHSKLNFVGDLNVSAYGVAEEGTGTTTNVEIVDNLTSTRTDAALSANQGRVLKELIDTKTSVSSWNDIADKPELLTIENIQKWHTQSHTHTNKSVLDSITSASTSNWNAAYTHISDTTKHITSTERTNWNKAYTNNHIHSNKSVLDGISSTKVSNWDSVYKDFNDIFEIEGDILKVKLNLVGEKQVSAYGFSDDAGGVVTVDVIDNLTSNRTDAALSANQGRVLKELIDTKTSVSSWDDITDKPELLTIENIQKWNTQTHTHSNKSVLDSITSALTTNWDAAYTHISDTTKHITSTERINWNKAYTNNHTHSNKAVLDSITSASTSNWNTAYTNNHTHSNKSVLDSITSGSTSNWNAAYTHISDSTKHITSTERTNWNKAYTNNHTHSNKAVLDGISSTKVSNWDSVYKDFNDIFEIEGDILKVKLNLVGEKQVSAYGFSDDTGGVVTVDVIDNLTSNRIDAALSANQGRVLKELIDTKTSVSSWDDITDKPSTFPPAAHTHTKSQITDFPTSWSWNNITGKPSSYTPSTHTHTISQVTNLQSTLDGKASSSHTHNYASTVKLGATSYVVSGNTISLPAYPTTIAWSNITGKPSSYTPSTHTHTISQVTNLQSTLDGKASSSHTHNYASTVKLGATSYTVSGNTISLPAYPSSIKNPYALTISLNGTSQGAYDGSAAKSINITASSVGAATASHTHKKSQITDFPTTWSWGNITNKPTTLSGYGITDGVNAVSIAGSGNAITAASVAGHTLTLTKGSTFLLSSQYTAADILAKLKTVDGNGSGLDADLLKGLSWSNFFSRRYYTINLSSYPTSNFYPLVFTANDIELDCEIHSNNTSGNDAYNQNRMHFQLTTQGWTDTGVSFRILSRNNYTDSEITIGAIGRGTETGGAAIWVRGGRTYRIYSNREPVFKSANYTYGTETYTVGTNLYGGSNTKVEIIWKNDANRNNDVVATIGGTVASANKLTTNAGSSTTPVYFSNGIPVNCSYSFGNASGNAAINNGTLCTNLNADKLDGTDKAGLLTALSSSSSTNISLTVGGTTKSVADLYATYSEKLLTARTIWGQSFNGSANISGNMTGVGSITASGNITTTANITANGTVVAKTASDARLKNVKRKTKSYQQRLLELGNIVDFEYNSIAKERNKNAVDDKKHIGLIYQNVANSDLSNFNYKEKDGYGSINYLSSDYINLIAGALQESIKEIKKLKQEIKKMKDEKDN